MFYQNPLFIPETAKQGHWCGSQNSASPFNIFSVHSFESESRLLLCSQYFDWRLRRERNLATVWICLSIGFQSLNLYWDSQVRECLGQKQWHPWTLFGVTINEQRNMGFPRTNASLSVGGGEKLHVVTSHAASSNRLWTSCGNGMVLRAAANLNTKEC